jgi:hypothetical protein
VTHSLPMPAVPSVTHRRDHSGYSMPSARAWYWFPTRELASQVQAVLAPSAGGPGGARVQPAHPLG